MYKKTCPFCKGESFSASSGEWICPYCRADISVLMHEPAGRMPRCCCKPKGEKVVYINRNYWNTSGHEKKSDTVP